jgi:hypothetical protein
MANFESSSASVSYEPSTTPSIEFHLFPQLPKELRLEIWNIIIGEPRRVHIEGKKRRVLHRRVVESWHSDQRIPSLLHICSESRFLGLSYYTPYFTTETCSKAIYLNLQHDAICFPDGMIGYLADRDRKEIRNMVLHCKDVDYFGHFNMAFILRMEGLRELEVWGDGTNVGPWYSNDRHIRTTKADFEEARNKDPGVSICDPPIPYALADACYSVGMSKS